MDWKTTKCTKCTHHKVCRRKNIMKGSEYCQVNLKLIEPRKREEGRQSASALLWSLFSQRLKKPKEPEKEKKETSKETINPTNNLINK